jgi:hypothetical protein
MVTMSTAEETILQSDRVPVFLGVNTLRLKKGLQSSNRTIDIPNELLKEQGNELNRGTSVQAPQITMSFEDLSVDMDMEQLMSESWATLDTFTGSHTGTVSGVHVWSAGAVSGVNVIPTGPTDKITKLVVSYVSGAYCRVGEGAIISSTSTNIAYLSSTDDNVNFAVGDVVIFQENKSTTNALTPVSSTITVISGNAITVTGYDPSNLTGTSAMFIYLKDNYAISATKWVTSGVPNTSVKGFDVFWMGNAVTISAPVANTSYIGYYTLSAAGTSVDLDSNDWRDSQMDILMLYNDYADNLIFSRYTQDASVTSIGFNFTADGNATQTYDFTTGKSMDYAGYINRRSMVAETATTTYDLDALNGSIFRGAEAVDPIAVNTTLNENTFEKNFLRVTSITPAGVRKNWTEVASGATPSSDEYAYVNGTNTITFGATIASGSRLEFTYLCDATAVSSEDAYKFDATAFDHTGDPDAVTGKYQPLTINTDDFNSRVDGVESSTFTLAYERSFYNAQGILAQRISPSQIGSIDGSFTTREGFSKTMRVISDGTYSGLTAGQQIDASTSSTYTNTNSVPLRVRLYDPKDNVTIVKTIEIESIQTTNISNGNNVTDASTFEVSIIGKKGNLKIGR